MEADLWGELPGRAYARGFLATYAQFLELDADLLLDAFKRGPGRDADVGPIPEEMLPRRGELRRHRVSRRLLVALGAMLALAGAIAVVALIEGSGDGGQGVASGEGEEAPAATSIDQGSDDVDGEPGGRGDGKSDPGGGNGNDAERSDRVKLVLRPTAEVWVCLERDDGRAVIAGETLAADDVQGPFRSESFDLGLGNGSVRITLDGNPVEVPAESNPLGFRFTPEGARELPPERRPDCV